jgi:hypothetical protein
MHLDAKIEGARQHCKFDRWRIAGFAQSSFEEPHEPFVEGVVPVVSPIPPFATIGTALCSCPEPFDAFSGSRGYGNYILNHAFLAVPAQAFSQTRSLGVSP